MYCSQRLLTDSRIQTFSTKKSSWKILEQTVLYLYSYLLLTFVNRNAHWMKSFWIFQKITEWIYLVIEGQFDEGLLKDIILQVKRSCTKEGFETPFKKGYAGIRLVRNAMDMSRDVWTTEELSALCESSMNREMKGEMLANIFEMNDSYISADCWPSQLNRALQNEYLLFPPAENEPANSQLD